MPRLAHRLALAALLATTAGCAPSNVSSVETEVVASPSEVLNPQPPAPADAKPATHAKPTDGKAFAPQSSRRPAPPALTLLTAALLAPTTDGPAPGEIALKPMKFDAYRANAVKNPKARLTVVDAWATWCGPCKENFPHLVQMHARYADKGLHVVSLSLDDPSDAKAVADARAFLTEKKAVFTNVLLDEEFGEGFDKLGITAIPAVFLYGPDGKELRRFTLEDADNQFTYDEVEQVIKLLLDGKPLPPDAPGEAPPADPGK
jgi:thiol-disulfide isomerase/thioredoxin